MTHEKVQREALQQLHREIPDPKKFIITILDYLRMKIAKGKEGEGLISIEHFIELYMPTLGKERRHALLSWFCQRAKGNWDA